MAADFRVLLETGYAPELARNLADRGYSVEMAPVWLPDGGYCAASDHRKEGCAVGF